MPVVNAQDTEEPTARAAHRANFGDCLVKYPRIELEAAIALWLQGSKQLLFLEVGKGFVR